jgi:hypothetical protein
MPQLTERRLSLARELRNEIGLSGVLTPDQARLFSQAIRLGWRGTGLSIWTLDRRAQQLRDARRLLEMAAVLTELGDRTNAEDLWRRAGDLFEWLARSRPDEPALEENLVPLTLLGAAAFQLAGLPAMASALLNQDHSRISAGAIFAAFLSANFSGVLDEIGEFWSANPDLTGPASETSISPDDPRFVGAELVRSLGLIAASLRMHQIDRLALSMARLRTLARVAKRSRVEDVWLVMELTAQVAERFISQSLWQGAMPLAQRMSSDGRDRLALYVRAMFSSGRGLLWPSQQEGVNRLVQGGSFALCTPTGSGKTTIAELALLDALYSENAPIAPLAIYLVPSRALAAEVEARLAGSIARVDSSLTITGLYGGTEWSLSDAWVTADGPTVLVSTVEMAEALTRHLGPLLIPRLAIIVVDEAHQVQFVDSPQYQENLRRAEHRSARLEQFLMRLFACAPSCRAVALSAVAGGVETAIACWMSRNEGAQASASSYRSTRQLIGALECRADNRVSLRLERLDGSELQLAGRDDAAYIPVPFVVMPKVSGKFKSDVSRFARAHSLWVSLQIASAERTVLISITRSIDSVASDFRELLEKVPSWQTAKLTVLRKQGNEAFVACVAACEDYCGRDSNELFLLRRGIAVHHGQLPVRVRRLMTDVIRSGATPVALATSTLTEGVNLPFDVVIVPSIRRSQAAGISPTGGAAFEWSILSAAEFLNLAGRAGRPGTSGEGMTLVALPTEPTAGVGTKSRRKQQADIRGHAARFQDLLNSLQPDVHARPDPKSPIAELLRLLHELWQRIVPFGTDAQFLEWLEVANQPEIPNVPTTPHEEASEALDSVDFILLSAIQESENLLGTQLSRADLETHLKRVWSCSFARFASSDQERLGEFFVRRGIVIPERIYPNPERRLELYRLGLPPRQGAAFLETAADIEIQLRKLNDFPHWTAEERFEFIKGLAEQVQSTPGFRFRTKVANWGEVLRWWLQVPGAREPNANEVQSWLHTATGDFEYRLGTALGTVLSAIWNQAQGDSLEVPSLDQWQSETNLPWTAMWIRELLAWGSLEPVVAYLMATNRATTRAEALLRLPEYRAWLQARDGDVFEEQIYHPRNLRDWARSIEPEKDSEPEVGQQIEANSVGRFPVETNWYPVVSIFDSTGVSWIDPAGYVLARSRRESVTQPMARHQRAYFNPSLNSVSFTDW